MIIVFTIPGEPVAKGRPKFTKAGHTYTPPKTVAYENLVKLCYKQKYSGKCFSDNAQLSVEVKAYMSIPKSKPKKWQAEAQEDVIRPTKRPDTDNILKIIQDALNGVAYRDDAQIVESICEKYYSDKPRVEVRIEEI